MVDRVLFSLAKRVARRGGGALRCWSCGCSAGHEPYGLAIAWECTLQPHFPTVSLEVVATDISDAALAEARLATYGAHAVSNLPVEWVARCFTVRDDDDARARGDKAAAKGGGGGGGFAYELKEHVRRRVTFARGDARFDVPDGPPFELIACRYAVFL